VKNELGPFSSTGWHTWQSDFILQRERTRPIRREGSAKCPKAEVNFTQDQWTGPIRENSFDPRRRNRDDTAMRLA
jgi:hypothetical protein